MIPNQPSTTSVVRRVVTLGLAATISIPSAFASDFNWKEVQFGGFASQGYLKSSANDYLGDTSKGTWDFREYAANASWSSGQWRIGAQVFGQKLGEYGDDKIKLDWASIDFQPKQWFGVRAGRVKMPRGLYNEALDVDSVRPFVLLPQSVYDARLRDFNASFDGGMFYGNVPVGKWGSVDYRLFYGKRDISLDSGANHYFNNDVPYPNLAIGIDDVRGGTLFWNTPVDGLRVGYSYNSFKNFTADRFVYWPASEWGPEFSAVMYKRTDIYERQLASAEYMKGDWVFAVEAGREAAIYSVGLPGMPPDAYMEFDAFYGYASVARRINRWLELGAYASYSKDMQASMETPLFPGYRWPDLRQHDYAVSARFDINEHTIIKLEGHYLDGAGKLFSTPEKPLMPGEADESWTMIAAKVTFQF